MRKGEPWGEEVSGPPELEVRGSDADLADALAAAGGSAGALVRLRPSPVSDLARAVGLGESPPGGVALPMDALRLPGGALAVNAVVLGTAPGRLRWWHRRRRVEVEVDGRPAFAGPATTVVVMNGQYLAGGDVAPRGHPGDGACEIQVYSVAPGQRRTLRSRLGSGSHLPHPAITTARGRRVLILSARPLDLELDSRRKGETDRLEVEVVPGAYRLLV